MQSKLNQAITLHPLFFDPVNKKALLMKKNGKEFVGYQEDRPGIIVTKDNEVIFSMYAPDAQSVEVSGVGGSMGKDRIVLEKDAEGYYTKKVSGIAPGFHYYDWYVDGVHNNLTKVVFPLPFLPTTAIFCPLLNFSDILCNA